jgi:hypothetical protein
MVYYLHEIRQYERKMPKIMCTDQELNQLRFDTEELDAETIKEIKFKVEHERKSNFYFLNHGALVFDQEVYDSELHTSFEFAGQIIELKMSTGEKLYLSNILINQVALDYSLSILGDFDEIGERKLIDPHYDLGRTDCVASLFKMPENASSAIYCTNYASEHDFYGDYQKLKFQGLEFNLLGKYIIDNSKRDWPLIKIS